jgi:hypothetical protein
MWRKIVPPHACTASWTMKHGLSNCKRVLQTGNITLFSGNSKPR